MTTGLVVMLITIVLVISFASLIRSISEWRDELGELLSGTGLKKRRALAWTLYIILSMICIVVQIVHAFAIIIAALWAINATKNWLKR